MPNGLKLFRAWAMTLNKKYPDMKSQFRLMIERDFEYRLKKIFKNTYNQDFWRIKLVGNYYTSMTFA
jgi:hypothetical protein